jgi:hypothetical protein
VIYSSGPHIVLFDELQKTQRFILINEIGPITAMCANSISKLLAIAIKGSDDGGKQNGAYIVIYDLETLKKKKMLTISQDATVIFLTNRRNLRLLYSQMMLKTYLLWQETQHGELMYLFFSTIFAWNIEKGKMVASMKTSSQINPQINEISINPFSRSINICIIGNGILRVYKFEDPNFKVVHQVKVFKVFSIS